ncbi:MAG: tRNA (guanosine(37)-N1)-methyltransferase TrmD [Spirochaetota bacterium]
MRMHLTILTLFPDFFTSPFATGVIDGAREGDLLQTDLVNLREYGLTRHRKCDDYPYGGGPGMVMSVEPFEKYYRANPKKKGEHVVLLTPTGTPLTQPIVKRLAEKERLTFICGHYEGVDGRVESRYADEAISIGDYVLSGGEAAALVIVDAMVRYFGVIGNDASVPGDTFEERMHGLLEHEQYTRPPSCESGDVDAVLKGGNHRDIEAWRRRRSVLRTFEYRSDLLAKAKLTAEDIRYIFEHLKIKEKDNG